MARHTETDLIFKPFMLFLIMLYTKKTFSYENSLEDSDVCLVGIPFDSTEIGNPVRFGPLFIREAIKNLPGYDPLLKKNIFG